MSSLFCICANKEWNRLAKKAPYAIEQLKVSYLMVNCCVCFNGDQTELRFGLMPSSIHVYLGVENKLYLIRL
jgi:hypothetical protein